jgi:signal transduction histidine kinase
METVTKYRRRQLLLLFLIFIFFSLIIVYSEYQHEKRYKTEALNHKLSIYSDLVYETVEKSSINNAKTLPALFKDTNFRISIIDLRGVVVYDSQVADVSGMQNHLFRPEIQAAVHQNNGSDVRTSTTTGRKYYYYAKRYADYFVRISVLYTLEARKSIEPNKLSLLFILILFLFSSTILYLFNRKFNKSLTALKEFSTIAKANKPIGENFSFPVSEIGNIGQNIAEVYQGLQKAKVELTSEKEKLIRHLNLLEEGIGIFSTDKHAISNNDHFVHFLNLISNELIDTAEKCFSIQEFEPIVAFIDSKSHQINLRNSDFPTMDLLIRKNSRHFTVKCIIFRDDSFEIIINDISKPEKRKILKQQITDNLAHELKTPVSSVLGFLETLIHSKLDAEKQKDFIKKAYSQTLRLADLINDISLLTKIEEASGLYRIEKMDLSALIKNTLDDVQLNLDKNNISVDLKNIENIEYHGNQVLIYSIFRNLFDNAVNYGGCDIQIIIDKYRETAENIHFSFSDTGTGVPPEDIERLFERFYRVTKGRDRRSGGSGLGLAIVKNAVLFHKGEISVKNRIGGGLEFIFSLKKGLDVSESEINID